MQTLPALQKENDLRHFVSVRFYENVNGCGLVQVMGIIGPFLLG